MGIKFQKHFVTNGTIKARVSYSLDNRTDHRACVTMYAKSFEDGDNLGRIFAEAYKNDTDSYSDYFDRGRVVLFADHACYADARKRAEEVLAERIVRQIVKRAERFVA